MKMIGTLKNIIVFVLILSFIGCTSDNKVQQNDEDNSDQNVISLKQDPDDLLAGVSKAVCYSGYRSGQHPDRGDGAVNPNYNEVLEDLRILTKDGNFKLIRIYDSGENSEMVLRVIKENKIDLKVMLGIWLDAELSNHEGCSWLTEPIPEEALVENKKHNITEIERGITLSNEYKDIIIAVNVGNEALVDWTDHLVDVDTIISYVKKVKKNIDQEVTVAENYKWWAQHGSKLSKDVDFAAIHIYPVWEGKDIDEGMTYSFENMEEVSEALPGVRFVISESGWATVASEFGDRAGEEKQLQYYNEIMDWAKEMNITTFFFEAFDEDWKGDPANMKGAEKHWGIFTIDRKPKKVMQMLYPELV
jgi:exo-beta-1,3-glucanase (GH17 family)